VTADATTTVIERGEAPSVDLGEGLLESLIRSARPDIPRPRLRAAFVDCLKALARPAGPCRGQRRAAERDRELDRVLLMLAEGWIAYEHYQLNRTRPETASLMGLTPRQLRTREQLLRRALDQAGRTKDVSPPFRGRPPCWHASAE
jgi:hypothetical protein